MLKMQKINSEVKRLTKQLPKRSRRRFVSGIKVLSLTAFKSLNAAGRRLTTRQSTGQSRIHRLIKDTFLGYRISDLLIKLVFEKRKGRLWLNLDHAQIGNFTVAIIAVQTVKGRALPLWLQINSGRQNAASKPLLMPLKQFLEKLRFNYPKVEVCLVGDRWFAAEALEALPSTQHLLFVPHQG